MGVIVPSHLAVVVTVLTALREEDTALMKHHSREHSRITGSTTQEEKPHLPFILYGKCVSFLLNYLVLEFSSSSEDVTDCLADVALAYMQFISAGGGFGLRC